MPLSFFFFFQAEDGIRDVAVTGVQTCALPIFPHAAAFVEKSGPTFVTLRGQGGEEVVISAWDDKEKGVTRVRASTLFFDQALDRFLSTLPLASQVEIA